MSRTPLIAPRRTVVRATAASALALLALAGCTSLAPDYARPMLPVPATLNGTNDYKIFLETFEGVAKIGIESLRITTALEINGATAATVDTKA